MSRRPASFTQADLNRAVRAAKQAGAGSVEVIRRGDEASILIHIAPSTAPQAEADTDRVVPL